MSDSPCICPKCGSRFTDYETARRHIRDEHGPLWQPVVCT